MTKTTQGYKHTRQSYETPSTLRLRKLWHFPAQLFFKQKSKMTGFCHGIRKSHLHLLSTHLIFLIFKFFFAAFQIPAT